MAIVINGSGTATGISVGGLPDGIVDAGTVAADVATQAEIDAKLALAGGTMTGTITSTASDTMQFTNDSQNQINFGDSGDANAGAIRYNHSLDKMSIRCAGDDNAIQILSDRTVLIGCDEQTPELPDDYDLTQMSIVNNHADGYCLVMHNEGNNDDRRGMVVACGYRNASGTNRAIDFLDGDGTLQGSITFASGTVSYGAFTANHDVELPNADNDAGYPYGTLVETSELFYKASSAGTPFERGIRYKVQKSSSAYSKGVLGAYAGKYNDGGNLHQVYVLGDGHILCSGEKGNITVGDGICTSSTDGIGMKADKMAMIIGIAQEDISFSGDESKLVAVQYGLQQFTPWE
jgi:hypothetical protein